MGSLFNDWIQLFDENNFKNIQNEPEQLKTINMLYITIQKEFKKVETHISQKLETLKNKCENPKENIFERTQSPILERHKSRLKKTKKNSNLESKKTINSSEISKSKVQYQINDSIENVDIFDSSIIPETPVLKAGKKSKRKLVSLKKNNYSQSKNSTLTQMFSEMSTKKNDTTDPSMMGIDEIIGRVNAEESLDKTRKKPKICPTFIDYDEVPKRVVTPKKTFVFKETVRGNARKNLPGWSCKDCENFYKGMRLTDKELEIKMNECSKHRSRFKPDEETMAGYWDLSIPPTPDHQKTQKSPSLSQFSQESVGHDSTIFL